MRIWALLVLLVAACQSERHLVDVPGPDGRPIALLLVAQDTDAPVIVARGPHGRAWLGRVPTSSFSVVAHDQLWALTADGKIVMMWDPAAKRYVSVAKEPAAAHALLHALRRAVLDTPLELQAFP